MGMWSARWADNSCWWRCALLVAGMGVEASEAFGKVELLSNQKSPNRDKWYGQLEAWAMQNKPLSVNKAFSGSGLSLCKNI